jgi:hypothetical protein
MQGRIQDFKLRGGALRKFLGYFVRKITILRQKIIFCPIAEGGENKLPYISSAWDLGIKMISMKINYLISLKHVA